MEIPLIYEDKNLIILNKPSGLVVHSDGKTKEGSVAEWLLEKYPEIKEVGEPWRTPIGEIIYRPGIVHRLDRETSGVLIVARNQETFFYLKNLFQTRAVSKIYNAFVYGLMKEKDGTIDRPIARSRKDFRLWSAQRWARGQAREAITNYQVLKEKDVKGGVSFLEVRPETGRTHQIRVHLKAINHPVVCDKLYAPKRESLLGFERLALHARSIEFKTETGEVIKAEAPFPPDFERALDLMT
ncbi:MAG TPA: RluA family pseudouridine synthase [Candidatus Paceibacterota bacterium]|nr:RluA family pseudouridine synthase [Candidatus Paceibacterota bacterium]